MTLVIDASVVAEVLLQTPRGRSASSRLGHEPLVAPNHLTAEVVSVLRGWSLGGHVDDAVAERALVEFGELAVTQVDMNDRLGNVWRLRHNLSAYDASYVVLARALDVPLLTLDRRIVSAAPDCAELP